ncbi:MAG: hypothetical protein JWL60_2478 [Gemmatimonadetes bacterium]|jgi:hypothetical protein|nr:hypothetical protein [Gemmatimonadota bacterium]
MSAMFASSSSNEARRKADQLASALTTFGTPCGVEPRGTLAVLRATPEIVARLAEPETRRAVLAAARAEGFTHVAVELA